jgi:hypothetical protein
VAYNFSNIKVDVCEFGAITCKCRQVFSFSFTISRVEFIKRQTNEASHCYLERLHP